MVKTRASRSTTRRVRKTTASRKSRKSNISKRGDGRVTVYRKTTYDVPGVGTDPFLPSNSYAGATVYLNKVSDPLTTSTYYYKRPIVATASSMSPFYVNGLSGRWWSPFVVGRRNLRDDYEDYTERRRRRYGKRRPTRRRAKGKGKKKSSRSRR